MDESGLYIEHNPVNIVSRKCEHVSFTVSCNSGNITIIECISAVGLHVVRYYCKGELHRSLKSFLQEDGPEQALWTWQGHTLTESSTANCNKTVHQDVLESTVGQRSTGVDTRPTCVPRCSLPSRKKTRRGQTIILAI